MKEGAGHVKMLLWGSEGKKASRNKQAKQGSWGKETMSEEAQAEEAQFEEAQG